MLKFVFYSVFFVCITSVLFSCLEKKGNTNDKILLSIHEIELIKENINTINELFNKLEQLGIYKSKLGYHIKKDSTLYFIPYCISEKERKFINSVGCNYDSLLGELNSKILLQCIYNLTRLDVYGCRFNEPFNGYTYLIGDREYQEGYTRYYMVLRDYSDTINYEKNYDKVYDIKNHLLLIGDPPRFWE